MWYRWPKVHADFPADLRRNYIVPGKPEWAATNSWFSLLMELLNSTPVGTRSILSTIHQGNHQKTWQVSATVVKRVPDEGRSFSGASIRRGGRFH